MMNRFKTLFLGAALIGGMAACSDEPDVDKPILGNETTTYVKVSLVSPNATSTRADGDGYESGSKDENKVNRIVLVFFDGARNYVGKTDINDIKDEGQDGDLGLGNTVERVLTTVAEVNLPENANQPRYVLAYVNPTTKVADLATSKLEDVMGVLRERNTVSNTGMTMNNTVYFDDDTNLSRFATTVDFGTMFFKTKEEAAAADAKSVVITVERVEAKVRASFPAKEDIADVTATGNGKDTYTLSFQPEYWFVNATEKRTFLIKNFREGFENVIFPELSAPVLNQGRGMMLTGLQSQFEDKRQSLLNDQKNLRSYWAIDPTYYVDANNTSGADLYPDVSYDVKYNGNIALPNITPKSYPLEYRSYNNVKKSYEGVEGYRPYYVKFDGNRKSHEYCLENTMSEMTLKSSDAKASITSVVVLGNYKIKKNGTELVPGTTTLTDGKIWDGTFYVRHEGTMNGSDNRIVLVADNEAKDYFVEKTGNMFFVQKVDASGNKLDGQYEHLQAKHLDAVVGGKANAYGVSHDDFKLDYPYEFISDKKQSEQWRTLKFKNEDKLPELYVFEGGAYKRLEMSADVKTRMYSVYGLVEKFVNSKAYFNVPLKHIFTNNTTGTTINAKDVKQGDFGVVRNHVYQLSINGITGLGTGIGDLEQPIVPPTDSETYYISAKLQILKWRVVNQSVDL